MCHVDHSRSRVVSATAAATRPVLNRKYTVAAATSGRAMPDNVAAASPAPNTLKARPAACTVITSDAMLNRIRCGGFLSFELKFD